MCLMEMSNINNNITNNRWDSSSRSLFVKTIWNGDHRHVILDKGDPQSEIINLPKTSRSRKSSGSSARNTPTKEVNVNCINLQVSKVGFLMSGDKELKKTPKQTQTQIFPNSNKTVTISVIPKKHVKFKSLTEELVLKNKKLLPGKCSNLNLDRSKLPIEDTNVVSPYFSYNKNGEKSNSSLSERVLMWMNLTQNDTLEGLDCKENYIKPDVKKRAVTTHTCLNLRCQPETYLLDRKYKLNSAKSDFAKITEENKSEIRSLQEVFEEANLSSHLEEIVPRDIKFENGRNRCDYSKRQLHIFMPNIPKRNVSDCDSGLSAKSSSFMKYRK